MKSSLSLKSVLCAALGLATISATPSYAANYICRGANAALYAKSVKQAVGLQLTNANIPFRKVFVTIKATDRKSTRTPAVYDASSNVTVTGNPLTLAFAGSFPAPTSCALPGTLRVVVINGNVKVLDQSTPITLTGELLLAGLGGGSSGSAQ